jgi:hypothetical protein
MPDRAGLWARIQAIQAQSRDLRPSVRQTCGRAARARQEAARTCQCAVTAGLRQSMPGASALTRGLTAAILIERGLLHGRLRNKAGKGGHDN